MFDYVKKLYSHAMSSPFDITIDLNWREKYTLILYVYATIKACLT